MMKARAKIGIIALTLIVLMFSTFYAQRPIKNIPSLLGIEVTTNAMDSSLRVPVNTDAGKKQLFVTVPVKDNAGEISAIRIVPVIENDKIKLDVFYLSSDYWNSKRCTDIHLLKSSRMETRVIEKDETLNLLEVTNDKDSPVVIKAITVPAQTTNGVEPIGDSCGCATCGRDEHALLCCPNKGQCLGCSKCGEVCCPVGEF